MVAGSTRVVLIVGILIGATLLGGIIGAGLDYVTGNAGWWGAGSLAGIIVGALAASMIVEGRRTPLKR